VQGPVVDPPAEPDAGVVSPESAAPSPPTIGVPGGSRELLALAAPLIVSQSFMTVQVFIDSLLLSWHDAREMAATLPAMLWFWQLFGLLQVTAGYVSTFVAQYTGANRPHRVGPAVWQGVYFAVIAGVLFLLMVPLAPYLIMLGGHTEALQGFETTYLRCLSFAALPMLVMAAVNGFFSGRGQTWTILLIEAAGTCVNVGLALVFVFGEAGVPKLGLPGIAGVPDGGIAAAGWCTVAGSCVSALVAIGLFMRKKYRTEFASLSGWRFDPPLFKRLVRFGGPAGMQVFQDVMVFNVFVLAVDALNEAAAGATALAIRLNMIAFLPMMGMAQAVCIMVGQRLGANRPEIAEKTTFTGMKWMFGYILLVAGVYLFLPHTLVAVFEGQPAPQKYEPQAALFGVALAHAGAVNEFEAIAALVPGLLACVALYSLAEAPMMAFAFSLRGAGDTKFVSRVTFALGWPFMVVPTLTVLLLHKYGYWPWGFDTALYTAWGSATTYIFVMAICFWLRFRSGKWKTMRVIEPAPVDDTDADPKLLAA
jgi:MATE family multidrug resistance protein